MSYVSAMSRIFPELYRVTGTEAAIFALFKATRLLLTMTSLCLAERGGSTVICVTL